jgi:hypothetical protein
MLRHGNLFSMRVRSTFGRVLAAFVIAGLALAPMARTVMAVPMSMDMEASRGQTAADLVAAAAPNDMPCCPDKPSLPDCSKDCPLMALCVTAPLHFASQAGLTIPLTIVSIVIPGDLPDLVSVTYAPPRKPPKA